MRLTQAVMLPLQSPDGLTPHLPAGTQGVPGVPTAPTVPFSASEGGMDRLQKPKTLPCKYCNKRFRSVEAPPSRCSRLLVLILGRQASRACPETREDAHKGEAVPVPVGPVWEDIWSTVSRVHQTESFPPCLGGPSLAELHWLLTGRVSPTPKNCQCNRPVFSSSSIRHSAHVHVPLPHHNLAAHSGYACFSHPFPTTSLLPSLLSLVPLPTQISTTCQGQGHLRLELNSPTSR